MRQFFKLTTGSINECVLQSVEPLVIIETGDFTRVVPTYNIFDLVCEEFDRGVL